MTVRMRPSVSRRSRRAFLRRTAALGLGLAALPLAQACAPLNPAPAPTSPPAATTPPAPAATTGTGGPIPKAPAPTQAVAAPPQAPAVAKTGGTLRLVQSSDIAPREPHLRQDANAPIGLTVWDTLARYDKNLKPQPVLAERWDWSPDYRTLTVKLRQGVKFHSGRELTAEDVELNIVRIREPAVGSQMRGASNQVKKIERPDRHTIVLGFDKPYLAIFDLFEALVITDRETVGDLTSGKVVGTGPFVWKEWVPNEKLVLEKNPSYWQGGEPLLDRIELTVISDVQAMAVQFEAGQQDIALRVSAQDFTRLRQDQRYQAVVMETGNAYFYVAADVTKPPLDTKDVRQAINHAINRERFVQTALSGIARPTTLPWPKASPAYDEALDGSVRFDLERARSLLQKAGVGSGFEMPITYNTQRTATVGKLVEILQSDLGQLGVKLNVQTQENTVFQRTLNEKAFGGLFTHSHGFSNQTPVSLFLQAFPFRKENASNFRSPEYDRLIDAMDGETDDRKLKELYTAMNTLLLDEAFIVNVSTNPSVFLARANVQNVDYNFFDWWALHRTTVG